MRDDRPGLAEALLPLLPLLPLVPLLPAALPGCLGGLKQGWAFSWRSLMAAELIVTSSSFGLGLGQLLDQSRQLFDMPGVLAGILAILVVGLAVELLVFSPVERAVLRRRGLVGH